MSVHFYEVVTTASIKKHNYKQDVYFQGLFILPYRYLDVIEQALTCGEVVLIENIKETLDPLLEPLLGRQTLKKGRQVICEDQSLKYVLFV